MNDGIETAYDRFVNKAMMFGKVVSEIEGKQFNQSLVLASIPPSNQKETIIVDLTDGSMIRKGNESEINITFAEWLALRELDRHDRVDAILDILEANSEQVDFIIKNDLFKGEK